MGILYIDGQSKLFDLFRVHEKFHEVFGNSVHFKTVTIKHPKNTEDEEYFCMQINIEALMHISPYIRFQIDKMLKHLENHNSCIKNIKTLETTPDLDYIFSINRPDALKAQANPPPETTNSPTTSP
ncbi:MAG: hypothetical protein P1U36_00810 [Legionellaceae bacterium]|nr:hypothetical protein [Legionellaceae bacterium]